MFPISPHGLTTTTLSGDEPLDHPLPALFTRALHYASRSAVIPALDPACQSVLQNAASDLAEISAKVSSLGMFADSDEEVTTTDAAYLLVDFVRAEVVGRLRADRMEDRIRQLSDAQGYLSAFISRLDKYHIIPSTEVDFLTSDGGSDPSARKEMRIKQNDAEKEIRSQIQTYLPSFSPLSDFDLYATLQRPVAGQQTPTVESRRELTFLLLRLAHLQARTQLNSITDELALLKSAAP